MNNFTVYFSFGLEHILSWDALDHILFIAALCMRYQFRDWKRLLVLITAFTIGHSATLVLATINIFHVNTALTEFLVALTILLTSAGNAFAPGLAAGKDKFSYGVALVFGMIHGLGFASGLQSIMGAGTSLLTPLLGFNIAIELAQLLIVSCVLLVVFALTHILQVPLRNCVLFASGIIFGLALTIAIDRYPFKNHPNEVSFFRNVCADPVYCNRPGAVLQQPEVKSW